MPPPLQPLHRQYTSPAHAANDSQHDVEDHQYNNVDPDDPDSYNGADPDDPEYPLEPEQPIRPPGPLGQITDPPSSINVSLTPKQLSTVDPITRLTPAFIRRVWGDDTPVPPSDHFDTTLRAAMDKYHYQYLIKLREMGLKPNDEAYLDEKNKLEKEGRTAYDDIGTKIENGEIDSVDKLREMVTEHSQLASQFTLGQIFTFFHRHNVDLKSWSWFALRIQGMLNNLETLDGGAFDPSLPPIAHAVIGHALLQDIEEFDYEVKDQRQVLARIQLEKSRRYRAALPKSLPTPSFEFSLRGLILVELEDWKDADGEFGNSIKRYLSLQRKPHYPERDLICLKAYDRVLESHNRIDDLANIVTSQYRRLFDFIRRDHKSQERTGPFVKVFTDNLLRIPDPVRWFERRFAAIPNAQGRYLGSMLFMAFTTAQNVERAEHAVRLFDTIIDSPQRIEVSSHHVVQLCTRLDDLGYPDVAFRVYLSFARDHPEVSRSRLEIMLRMFIKHGRMEDAAEIQKQILERYGPTPYTLHCMARAYADRGDANAASKALEVIYGTATMENPTSLQIIQTAYINDNDPDNARKILTILTSVEPDSTPHWNRQLWFYANRGEVAPAIQLFDEFLATGQQPNVQIYTALVKLFGGQQDIPNVNRIVEAVLDSGIEPDEHLCAAILNADIKSGNYDSAASRWLAFPETFRYHPRILSSILKAFVYLSAPVTTVMSLFQRIEKPDIANHSMALLSLIDHMRTRDAKSFIEWMDEKSLRDPDAPTPNVYHFSMLMYGYLRVRDNTTAREIYDEITLRRMLPTSVTYAMIIQSFLRNEDKAAGLREAHSFAMSIMSKSEAGFLPDKAAKKGQVNSKLFGPLISAAGKMGKAETAQAYFELATADQPRDIKMYSRLMDAYRRSGDTDQVMILWEKVFNLANEQVQPHESTSAGDRHGILPNNRVHSSLLCIPLSIVIDSLSSQQRLDDILNVWKSVREAGFSYDAQNYQHLVVAFTRCGHVEGAFHVVDRILLRKWFEVLTRRRRAIRERKKLILKPGPEVPSEDQMLKEDQDRRYTAEEFNDPEGKMFTPPQVLYREEDPIDADSIEAANDVASRPNVSGKRRLKLRRQEADKFISDPVDPDVIISRMLTSWRPGDLDWRPSIFTKRILSIAYGQIQLQRRSIQRAMRLPVDEHDEDGEDEEGKEGIQEDIPEESPEARQEKLDKWEQQRKRVIQPHLVTLPEFNNAAVLNGKGVKVPTTPSAILYRLNRKYRRVVDSIIAYRRMKNAKAMIRRRQLENYVIKQERQARKQRWIDEKRRRKQDHRALPNYELEAFNAEKAEELDKWLKDAEDWAWAEPETEGRPKRIFGLKDDPLSSYSLRRTKRRARASLRHSLVPDEEKEKMVQGRTKEKKKKKEQGSSDE